MILKQIYYEYAKVFGKKELFINVFNICLKINAGNFCGDLTMSNYLLLFFTDF